MLLVCQLRTPTPARRSMFVCCVAALLRQDCMRAACAWYSAPEHLCWVRSHAFNTCGRMPWPVGAASECARADGARRGGRAPANASSPTGARLQGSCTLLSAPGRPARLAHPKPHTRSPSQAHAHHLARHHDASGCARDRRSSARPALARLPDDLKRYSASSRWVAHRSATRQGVARLAVLHAAASARTPHTLPCTSCPPCLQIGTSVHSYLHPRQPVISST